MSLPVKIKSEPESALNLATILTVSRFFLVPVFIYYFLVGQFRLALLILVIASITDVTDGLLARRFNMGTKLGSVLDPLADKFLMMISFLVLSAKDILPSWLAFVVIGRDFYIVFGLIWLYYYKKVEVVIKPSILSKRTTFVQFLLLAFSFLKVYLQANPTAIGDNYLLWAFQIQWAFVWIAGLMTIATFVQYTQIGLQWLKSKPKS